MRIKYIFNPARITEKSSTIHGGGTSNVMRSVKSKNTKIEIKYAHALWHKGVRFRQNVKSIFGVPDLAIKKIKLAIFIDSEFWHGKNWDINKNDHKSNIEYWHNKIEKNIERDKLVNETLKQNGWKVLRFWGEEIEKKLDACINKTIKTIKALRDV